MATEFDLEMAVLSMDAYNNLGGVDEMTILPKGSLDASYDVGSATYKDFKYDSTSPSAAFAKTANQLNAMRIQS